MALRLNTVRRAVQACSRNGIVHDLALERRHGSKRYRWFAALHLLDGTLGDGNELSTPCRPEACHVQHQATPLAGLAIDGETGQLLKGFEDLAAATNQVVEVAAHNLDGSAVTINVHVDVAIEVGDVEQLLEEIGGDVAFLFEALCEFSLQLLSLSGLAVMSGFFLGCWGPVLGPPRCLGLGAGAGFLR